jgi:hypothetical protein
MKNLEIHFQGQFIGAAGHGVAAHYLILLIEGVELVGAGLPMKTCLLPLFIHAGAGLYIAR